MTETVNVMSAERILEDFLKKDEADVKYSPLRPHINRVISSGHSVAAHGGASGIERGYANLVAAALDAQDYSFAMGGAVLGWAQTTHSPLWPTAPYPHAGTTGDGGFSNFLQNVFVTRRGIAWRGAWSAAKTYAAFDGVFTGSGLTARYWVSRGVSTNQSPLTAPAYWREVTGADGDPGRTDWAPMPAFHVINYGLNDLGWGKDLSVFLQHLRVLLARCRAAQVWEIMTWGSDSSNGMIIPTPAFGAGFATASFGSGVGIQTLQGRAVGSTIDVMIPPDWPGGKVRFGFTANDTVARSGRMNILIDDVVQREINFNLARSYTTVGSVNQDIAAWQEEIVVPSGKHVVQLKTTEAFNNPAAAFFNYVSLDAVVPNPVIVVGVFKPLSYAAYTAPLPTDADVDTWNTGISAMLAAEFPEAKFVVPSINAMPLTERALYFTHDDLHPNDAGHRRFAMDILAAIDEITVTEEQQLQMIIEPREGQTYYAKLGTAVGNTPFTPSTLSTYEDVVINGRSAQLSVPALPGDLLEIGINGIWDASTTAYGAIDAATIVRGARTNFVSSGNSVGQTNGMAGGGGLVVGTGIYPTVLGSPVTYYVRPEDVVNGAVTIQLIAKNVTAARAIMAGGVNGFDFYVKHLPPFEFPRLV